MKIIFLLLFLLGGFILYKGLESRGTTTIAIAVSVYAIVAVLAFVAMFKRKSP